MMAFNTLDFFMFSVDTSEFGMFYFLSPGRLWPSWVFVSFLGLDGDRIWAKLLPGQDLKPGLKLDETGIYTPTCFLCNYENRFNWIVHCLTFGQPSNHASLNPHYLNLTLCFVFLQISLLPFWELWDGNVVKVF